MKPRADGRHQVSQRVQGKRIYGYGHTPEEAQNNLADKVAELTPSIDLTDPGDSETTHHFAKRVWYPAILDKAPLTVTRYRSVYRTHIKPRIGHLPIGSLTYATIQQLVYDLKADGVPSPTIRYVVERLSTITRLAIRHKKLHEFLNPCTDLAGLPSKPPKRERACSLDKALEVLAGVEGTDLSAPVLFALFLGLRRGEIAGLKWEHLDRQRGELKVCKQRQAQSGKGVVEKNVKSESFRTHRLTRLLVAEIDRRGNLDSEFICTRKGEPWVPQTIYDDWILVRKDFGLEEWTLHDLRHGAAGLLYATGSDLLEAAAVLGHKHPAMTLKYTSVTEERAALSIERLVERMGLGVNPGCQNEEGRLKKPARG